MNRHSTRLLPTSLLIALFASPVPPLLCQEKTAIITIDGGESVTVSEKDLQQFLRQQSELRRKRTSETSGAKSPPAPSASPSSTSTPSVITFRSGPGFRSRVIPPGAPSLKDNALSPSDSDPGRIAAGVAPSDAATRLPLATGNPIVWKSLPQYLSTFRLRASWDSPYIFKYDREANAWVEDSATQLSSDGAEFGWISDRLTDSDQWTAKGVAALPYVYKGDQNFNFVITPSVEFNRDTSTDGTENEINSLTPRLGFDFNLMDATSTPTTGWILRSAVGYQTDFNFDSAQWLFDFQVDRIKQSIGLNAIIASEHDQAANAAAAPTLRLFPQIRHKFTLAPIFSLGSIQDTGEKLSLLQLDDNYGTIGFKAGLDLELNLLPEPFQTTKLGAEYRWWTTIQSDAQSYDYLEARLLFPVGPGTLAFKAFYRLGTTPDTLEEVDTMGVALTARF